jgi:predicted DsbA family dithiol-disulfide isomerase
MNAIPLTIDIVSDVVCPWCFIGKRQLEAALAQWRQERPEVAAPLLRWHAFQLNPDLPEAGIDRGEYLLRKFGDATGAAVHERVRAAARLAGVELALEAIRRQPNTLKAHALIAMGGVSPLASTLAEALFVAHFQQGRDLTDDAVLREIGRGAGLDDEALEAALDDPTLRRELAQADRDLRAQGINGVPLFVFSSGTRQAAVSGAQGAPALRAALERVVGPA